MPLGGRGVRSFSENSKKRKKWSGILILTNFRRLISSFGCFLDPTPANPSPPPQRDQNSKKLKKWIDTSIFTDLRTLSSNIDSLFSSDPVNSLCGILILTNSKIASSNIGIFFWLDPLNPSPPSPPSIRSKFKKNLKINWYSVIYYSQVV